MKGDMMKLTVTVNLRDDEWHYIATREIQVDVSSAKELEQLAYGTGQVTEAHTTGIAKRLLAAENMGGAGLVVREVATEDNE